MISIIKYLNEGVLFKIGKAVDNINDKIDKSLQKTSPGRTYMKFEDTISDAVRQGKNNLGNFEDQILRKNYKVRR